MGVQTSLRREAAAGEQGSGPPALPRRFDVLLGVVLANYAAQIPYSLHLYGLRVNGRGVALLAFPLLWFIVGYVLLTRRSRVGYWLTLSFLAVQFAFYFRNEILLIPYGYGLPYHLLHAKDVLLWVVFLIGDINFVVAAYFVIHLLIARPTLTGRGPAER